MFLSCKTCSIVSLWLHQYGSTCTIFICMALQALSITIKVIHNQLYFVHSLSLIIVGNTAGLSPRIQPRKLRYNWRSWQDNFAAAMASKPVILPEPFDGESSWEDWQLHFQNVAALNQWTDVSGSAYALLDEHRGRFTVCRRNLRIPTKIRLQLYGNDSSQRAGRLVAKLSLKRGGRRKQKDGPILRTICDRLWTKHFQICK